MESVHKLMNEKQHRNGILISNGLTAEADFFGIEIITNNLESKPVQECLVCSE